jgi:hypothetical protein
MVSILSLSPLRNQSARKNADEEETYYQKKKKKKEEINIEITNSTQKRKRKYFISYHSKIAQRATQSLQE